MRSKAVKLEKKRENHSKWFLKRYNPKTFEVIIDVSTSRFDNLFHKIIFDLDDLESGVTRLMALKDPILDFCKDLDLYFSNINTVCSHHKNLKLDLFTYGLFMSLRECLFSEMKNEAFYTFLKLCVRFDYLKERLCTDFMERHYLDPRVVNWNNFTVQNENWWL